MTTFFAPQSDLQFTRFPSISETEGTSMTLPFAAWVQQRMAAASTYWPAAGELSDELDGYRRDVACCDDADEVDEHLIQNEKLWAATVKAAKQQLYVEVGATLIDNRRADANVMTITWLFCDIDGIERDRLSALVAKLRSTGLCFYACESATSRLPLVADDKTGPYRVHIYVPLQPIVLPAGVPTAEIKTWWRKIYAAAVAGLVGGVTTIDTSVDDLSQPCFVAQVPPCGDRRSHAAVTDGNFLDLEAYVLSLGHNISRPVPHAAQQQPTQASVAAQPQSITPRPAASEGPTPGETTGSLVHKAILGLGLLGRLLDGKRGMWSCRCPWHRDHQTDPTQAVLDSSTVIFEDGSVEGGFSCKHNGCRAANGGIERTAQDVLSLARRRGVHMPDRSGWDGGGAASSEPAPNGKQDPRLRVVVKDDALADMRDAAISSLTRRGDIFVKDGQIVDVTATGYRVTTREHLAAVLSETARFVRVSVDKEGNFRDKAVEAPRNVVDAVLKLGNYPSLRPLRAVVTNPALLPSGRVLIAAGYDAESALIYRPTAAISVPSAPTKADAEAAAKRLLGFVKHTQWCDDRGPSVWLSLVLTIVGRAAMPTVPSFGFDAAVRQSGKTSLVKIAYGITHGKTIGLGGSIGKNEEENEKRLAQWSEESVVLFDNLAEPMSSVTLDAAITGGTVKPRHLGKNKAIVCDLTSTTFTYTGNNLTLGDDAASRTLIARIKQPTHRNYDFSVDDGAFYTTQRPGAVSDALTILRAFIVAGSPQSKGGDYCRFPEWDRLIRAAVKWLGMADPWGGEVVDTNDITRNEAMLALAEWQALRGNAWEVFYASDLDCARFRDQSETDDAYRARRRVVEALSEIAGKKCENAIHVGRALQKLRDGTITAAGKTARFAVIVTKNKTKYSFVPA